ncbi:MAG: hydrogenase maturation protease [Spirochaetota bacterium]|nr:MAG: hydrogenase maturation protease [Spirochaetota bacterium]
MSKRKKKIAVVGVGNTLMADEGSGVRVIDELKSRGYEGEVDLIDAGTSFFNIVQDVESYDKLIIVDAVKGGGKPGTIYRFKLSDTETERLGSLTVHDIGVVQSLKLYSINHRIPEEIVFFGIEPSKIELSMEISGILEPAISRLVVKVIEEINKDF